MTLPLRPRRCGSFAESLLEHPLALAVEGRASSPASGTYDGVPAKYRVLANKWNKGRVFRSKLVTIKDNGDGGFCPDGSKTVSEIMAPLTATCLGKSDGTILGHVPLMAGSQSTVLVPPFPTM